MKTIITALLLFTAGSAHADPQIAIAEFGLGQKLYDQGDYENALVAFQTSYGVSPLPTILYDMALTHYQLGNIYAARSCLRSFMRGLSRKSPYAQRAERLGDKIAAITDEDYEAMGLDFACDSRHVCGIARWPADALRAYNARK